MIDPRETDTAAYHVAAVPDSYTTREHRRLFDRGFRLRSSDGELDRQAQIKAIETAGICAWKQKVRTGEAKTPLVDDPGLLAVDIALAAICIMDHPTLEDTAPRNLQGLEYLCELYSHNLQQLIARRDGYTIEQTIAENIYAKDSDSDSPHPGRVCTDIGQIDAFDTDKPYVEIPMPAASDEALVRTDGDEWGAEYDPGDNDITGHLLTRVHDNSLYVPAAHLSYKHHQYLRDGGFSSLVTSMEQMLSAEQRNWVTREATDLSDRISRFERTGHLEELYTNWDPNRQAANLVRNAVFEAPNLDADDPLQPSDIQSAVDLYDPDKRVEDFHQRKFSSNYATRRTLEELAEAGHIESESSSPDPDSASVYYIGSNTDSLNIGSIQDLFTLPCMANMAERLHEEGPVRKDLFSFARMVMWLPQYRDVDVDIIVEDLKEVFQQFPWYDEQETEYQVRYEYHQGEIDGEPPLPRNCHNENLQRYCIGTDECPYYTIYQSLPFPQEMYDYLDQDSSEFRF